MLVCGGGAKPVAGGWLAVAQPTRVRIVIAAAARTGPGRFIAFSS
jgi:hypothetical protein